MKSNLTNEKHYTLIYLVGFECGSTEQVKRRVTDFSLDENNNFSRFNPTWVDPLRCATK